MDRWVAGAGDVNQDGYADFMVSDIIVPYPTGEGRVHVFAGAPVYLQADPQDVGEGDSVMLSARGGPSGALAACFLTAVAGVQTCQRIGMQALDANGECDFGGTIPPGLDGINMVFQVVALTPGGGWLLFGGSSE